MKCQYCGFDLPNGTRVCSVCGSPVPISQGTVLADSEDLTYNQSYVPNSPPQQNYNNAPNNNFYQPQNPDPNFGQQFNQPNGNFNPPMNDVPPIPNAFPDNNFNQPLSDPNGQPLIPCAPNLTKEQFVQLPMFDKINKSIKSSAITGYVCAGITAVFNLVLGNPSGLIDVAILLGLSLGIHFKKSFACAVAILVYSIINIIVCLVLLGRTGGILILFVGIYSVKATSQLNKLWKSYITTGGIPPVIQK